MDDFDKQINNFKYKKTNQKKIREYNVGIGIIRVILSFMVVFDHLYDVQKKQKFIPLLHCHIPTFFVISFYFNYNTLTSFNIEKIKIRFERLLIPYFLWSVISWIIFNFYYYILNKNVKHTFIDFIINLLNGRLFDLVLWFQNNLIIITILFLIIIFLFKKKYLIILYILCVICYALHYSDINYKFFKNNFSHHSAITFGRYSEMFPLAVTGFSIAAFNLIEKIRNYKKNAQIISLIILFFITKYNVFSEKKSFKYSGFRLNISAICLFINFSLISTYEIAKSKFTVKIIKKISGYTGGIYFTHYLIGRGYIIQKISFIKRQSLSYCIVVYLLSYLTCCFCYKIFGKTNLRHLFS